MRQGRVTAERRAQGPARLAVSSNTKWSRRQMRQQWTLMQTSPSILRLSMTFPPLRWAVLCLIDLRPLLVSALVGGLKRGWKAAALLFHRPQPVHQQGVLALHGLKPSAFWMLRCQTFRPLVPFHETRQLPHLKMSTRLRTYVWAVTTSSSTAQRMLRKDRGRIFAWSATQNCCAKQATPLLEPPSRCAFRNSQVVPRGQNLQHSRCQSLLQWRRPPRLRHRAPRLRRQLRLRSASQDLQPPQIQCYRPSAEGD